MKKHGHLDIVDSSGDSKLAVVIPMILSYALLNYTMETPDHRVSKCD